MNISKKNQLAHDKGQLIFQSLRRNISSYYGSIFFTIISGIIFYYLTRAILDFIYLDSFNFDYEDPFPVLLFPTSLVIFITSYAIAASRLEQIFLFEKRIDIQRGIFFRSHEVIWLYEVKDIRLTRSPIESLTGNATINITTENGIKNISGLSGNFRDHTISIEIMNRVFEYLIMEVRKQRQEVKNFLT